MDKLITVSLASQYNGAKQCSLMCFGPAAFLLPRCFMNTTIYCQLLNSVHCSMYAQRLSMARQIFDKFCLLQQFRSINPGRACAARVTVHGLSVSVHL